MNFEQLKRSLIGELHTDPPTRWQYATDASLYEELPLAVAIPRCDKDVLALIRFANTRRIGLIPRTAGTSLAGQVVGPGIIVDVSKHFTEILEVDADNSWVRVQPGVIRDDLNRELARHGLYFAPETSTSNRAMIGGMIGNNSSGANSIVHGDTRSHVLQLTGFLSDGTKTTFEPVDQDEFHQLRTGGSLIGKIYDAVHSIFSKNEHRIEIRRQFPRPEIHRRNTGYALDSLIDSAPFGGDRPLNLCQLLAGSEGTLFFTTEARLKCVPLPDKETTLVCAHFNSIDEALQANVVAMSLLPNRCELVDHYIIGGVREYLSENTNQDFFAGHPAAVLMIEFNGADQRARAQHLVNTLTSQQLGFDYPLLSGDNARNAWKSRKAALGGLSNVNQGRTAVAVIEDAAVEIHELPDFVAEVTEFLRQEFAIDCVVYGHAGAGELHLRPWLDPHDLKYRQSIRKIATGFARIVKRYRGSLSGEHGSGRCRSEFIEAMVGQNCWQWMQQIKTAFDPSNIFNPGKIVDPVPMDERLRSAATGTNTNHLDVVQRPRFRFEEGSLVDAVSRCSGSGDCRKSHLAAGAMCPSYQATRNESETTRGRANLLRQHLSGSVASPVSDHEVRDILELCLSCKACKLECPSKVDMSRIKAEFVHQYDLKHGIPLRTRVLANFEQWCVRIRSLGALGRFATGNTVVSTWTKWLLGIHADRKLPIIARQSLRAWYQNRPSSASAGELGKVLLFCDEFTNQIDVDVGIAAIELLEALGYEVKLLDNVESGRSAISLGHLAQAKHFAETNVCRLAPHAAGGIPIIGIEPSAILTLRDEYPDLVGVEFADAAGILRLAVKTIDEFLATEVDRESITSESFRQDSVQIFLHGHCHQKALSSTSSTLKILSLPAGCRVEEISAGCCGMAGFFGYDRKKFQLSQQIGELLLFPAIRQASQSTIIAATGTSCRQQIRDATAIEAFHPVQVLRKMLHSR